MTPEQAKKLRAPFPDDVIGTVPKGGRQLKYVGHAAITDRLLSVDPDWTWEPLARDEQGLPALDKRNNMWIRLTVCGVTRVGVGDGASAKEVIGDAIRNAAMRFGVALDLWAEGFDLWAEQADVDTTTSEMPPERDAPQPPATPPKAEPEPTKEQRGRLFTLLGEAGAIDKDQQLAVIAKALGQPLGESRKLNRAQADTVINYLEKGGRAA